MKSPFFFEEKALDRWNYQGIESSVVLDRWHSLEHCIWRSGRARWIDRLIIGRASMPPAASSRAGSLPLLGIHLLGSRPPDLRPGLPSQSRPESEVALSVSSCGMRQRRNRLASQVKAIRPMNSFMRPLIMIYITNNQYWPLNL